jgi:hypothetical protein
VVIGRRSLGHGARRRPDVTDTHRRMGIRELSARPDAETRGCQGPRSPGGDRAPMKGEDARQAKGARRGIRSSKTVRGRPGECSLVLTA